MIGLSIGAVALLHRQDQARQFASDAAMHRWETAAWQAVQAGRQAGWRACARRMGWHFPPEQLSVLSGARSGGAWAAGLAPMRPRTACEGVRVHEHTHTSAHKRAHAQCTCACAPVGPCRHWAQRAGLAVPLGPKDVGTSPYGSFSSSSASSWTSSWIAGSKRSLYSNEELLLGSPLRTLGGMFGAGLAGGLLGMVRVDGARGWGSANHTVIQFGTSCLATECPDHARVLVQP